MKRRSSSSGTGGRTRPTYAVSGKPTITVGSVGLKGADFIASLRAGGTAELGDLSELEARVQRGEFDLVAVGRALLSDAHWAAKVRDGRVGELAPFSPESLKQLA